MARNVIFASQRATLLGGRVIGVAGGPAKQAFLRDELGLDGAIDRRSDDIPERLAELAPDGVDVFFDNVGGELLDDVLDVISERARVVICGAISQYEHMDDVRGPTRYLRLAERYATMAGFTVLHFADRLTEAEDQITTWLADGRLRTHEHVDEGIESFGRAVVRLFDGSHIGKLLVAV